jgi:hypothetical protein
MLARRPRYLGKSRFSRSPIASVVVCRPRGCGPPRSWCCHTGSIVEPRRRMRTPGRGHRRRLPLTLPNSRPRSRRPNANAASMVIDTRGQRDKLVLRRRADRLGHYHGGHERRERPARMVPHSDWQPRSAHRPSGSPAPFRRASMVLCLPLHEAPWVDAVDAARRP